jgi:multiple sugar transport system substrate-binding protein
MFPTYGTKHISVFLIMSVMLIFLAIAGCSEPAPPPEPVTITFGYTGFENRSAEREYYQEMADQFHQQYPHITVEVGFDDLFSVFMEGEADKDVFLILKYVFETMQPDGYIIPLDAFIESDPAFPVDDFLPGVLDFYTLDGKIWGIPASINPYVIFYNKELFDKKGIPYPHPDWNWDDFLEVASSLRDPDAGIYGYGSTNFYGPDTKYVESFIYIYQHGGSLFDDYRRPIRMLYDDPRMIEALEWYTGLYTAHDVAPTEQEALDAFGGTTDNTIAQGIASGKVGMWGGAFSSRDGSYFWPVPWSFPVGILPPPHDERSFYLTYSNAYVISSGSQYPEEAWLWISFLCDQTNPDFFPMRKSMLESKEFENYAGSENVDTLRMMVANLEPVPLFIGDDIAQDWNDFGRVLTRIIDKGGDFNEVLDWAEDQ